MNSTSPTQHSHELTLTLHRIFVAHVLAGFLASFCVPAVYVTGMHEAEWEPGPSVGGLLFFGLQAAWSCLPSVLVLAVNLYLLVGLIRSFIPDAVHSVAAMYAFAVLMVLLALAGALLLGVVFMFWYVKVWAVGPGICLWFGSLVAIVVVAYSNQRLESLAGVSGFEQTSDSNLAKNPLCLSGVVSKDINR